MFLSAIRRGIEAIRTDVLSVGDEADPCDVIWSKYKAIFDYLDDWVVVKTNEENTEITDILLHRNQKALGKDRVETIDWKK